MWLQVQCAGGRAIYSSAEVRSGGGEMPDAQASSSAHCAAAHDVSILRFFDLSTVLPVAVQGAGSDQRHHHQW